MKLALDPAMLGQAPVRDMLEAAAEAGYRYLELGNRDDLIGAFKQVAADRSRLSQVRRWASDAGVELVSVAVIQAWSSPDEDARQQALDWWRGGMAAAAELGCTRINTELSGDPSRPEACRNAFLRSIEALLPSLEREGVDVVAEPHPGDFAETTAEAIDLVRGVGSPRFRYLHCLPHTFYLGGTPREQVDLAGTTLDHVHVADTFRPRRIILNPAGTGVRVHQHFDIGQGEIDWDQVRDSLRAVGFDGLLTVQVFCWEERALDSFRANRLALEGLLELG
jgi:myo-inositol catabolism protein IolH